MHYFEKVGVDGGARPTARGIEVEVGRYIHSCLYACTYVCMYV